MLQANSASRQGVLVDDVFPLPGLPPNDVIHVCMVELDRPSNTSVDRDGIVSADEEQAPGVVKRP
jgi:hypothetical protein